MLKAGGAEAAVAAMQAHPVECIVQQEACSALGNMAGGDLESQKAVLAAGGAAAAVAALRGAGYGVPIADVAAQACGALGNIAGGDEECQKGVLAAGGAAAVVKAMKAHAQAQAVQQGGKAALANMAWAGGELRDEVLAAGAEPEWLQ